MADKIHLPLSLRFIRQFDFPHKLGICERLFSNQLRKNGICWVETAAGPVWKLDLSNSTHRWIVYGQYEGSAFFSWIRRSLSGDAVIVDSGANIGQMTLYFGTYFPKSRVLAFEPGAHQANWLSECLARNPKVAAKILPYALGESEQTMYLKLGGHPSSHGSQNVVTMDVGETPVHVVTLAHVLASEQIETVDLWKLDVEGSELAALAGAKEWLKAKRIRALWIETMGENGRRIVDFMTDMGYRAVFLNRRGYETGVRDNRAGNTLFLPA
jgi:FkbM family methyltransferase